jgi:PPM family protein phosphatase
VIPVKLSHLAVAVQSHVGMKRRENEDRFAIAAYRISQSDPTPSLVAIVADGVGGHRAGEIAAQLAVDVILKTLASSEGEHPVLSLQAAFEEANQAINNLSIANPAYSGMSTTVACAWVIGDHLFIASVGDSRIYLLRGESILQLSTDHTWVQEAVDSGVLTLEEAREHPNAHVIRRHLGSQDGVIPDMRLRQLVEGSVSNTVANQGMRLLAGDGLLLCSDGLTDLVQDAEILAGFREQPFEAALSRLVALANARGGHDNITLVGMQMPMMSAASPMELLGRKKPLRYLVFVIFFVVLVGALISSYFLSRNEQATPTITPTSLLAPVLPSVVPTANSPLDLTPTFTITGAITPFPQITQTERVGTPVLATYTPWPTSTGVP